jgi:hypothetical protein
MIDLSQLTLGEVATLEKLGEVPITAFGGDDVPMGRPLAAMLMIHRRRNGEPTATFNAALATPIAEARAVLGLDAAPAPAAAEDATAAEEPQDPPRTRKRAG